MTRIAEPTLEHYLYYLRRIEGDNGKAIENRRATFSQELRSILAHLGQLSDQPLPTWEWPEENQDRRVSQLIMRTSWLKNSATDRSYFVAARTYSDIYWLQTGYYQKGKTSPDVFASLRDEMWLPSATDHLLGSSVYLCGIADDKVKELAVQGMKAFMGHAPGALVSTQVAKGRARLYGVPQFPHAAMLLYPDAECEKWVGENVLNDIALRIELYKHKVDRQLTWCEENLPILSKQERTLRDLLEKVGQLSQADLEILRQLVRLYRVFNSNVGMFVERQTTIGINLDNLDVVLEQLKPLAKDRFLSSVRDHLRQRYRQLEADIGFADQTRGRADGTVNALKAELGLDRLIGIQTEPSDATPIGRTRWPSTSPLAEPEIAAPTLHPKPSQPVTYPRIEVSTGVDIELTAEDKVILQRVYQGYDRVLIEKAFSGGYSGTQVLLVQPITIDGLRAARKVTKLGPTFELRKERDNYEQYVKPLLPFCAAGIERDEYYERGNRAGLNYYFVGDGALGQVMDLEQYYRRYPAGQIIKTLNDLLDRELGQRWYEPTTPLTRFFAAEYGPHIVEHLRLKLHALWIDDQPPPTKADYQRVEVDAIPHEYETIQPGTLLSINGLVVARIRHDEVKLQDPDEQGVVVRVELDSESTVIQRLNPGDRVSVRGEVLYNRRGRLEHIVHAAFPDLSPGVESKYIELPGVPRVYPNPLKVYRKILGKALKGRASYVHGDLHLRNVLVDEWGKGWLIDFARVAKRHVLFDFVKLETHIRLMELADRSSTFSMDDYTLFEAALTDATLERREDKTCPCNQDLENAFQIILAIRRIARNCMARESSFLKEYLPALFLYSLAVTKYYREETPEPARLAFATASVLGSYLDP